MDRSLGKSNDAIALYREILEKDATNLPAKTGLILAMFEAGQRADAETELAKSLDENPGNVMLLAGTAYWYAVHDEGAKAVTFAQKAVDCRSAFYLVTHRSCTRTDQAKQTDGGRTGFARRPPLR